MAKILLIEDDPHQRLLYRLELEDAGYQVLLACCGSDAIGLARQEGVHLVLVNPSLPDMQFEVFVRVLKSVDENLPILAHSGDTQRGQAYQDLVDGFVLKGSDLEPLKKQIVLLLKQKGAQHLV